MVISGRGTWTNFLSTAVPIEFILQAAWTGILRNLTILELEWEKNVCQCQRSIEMALTNDIVAKRPEPTKLFFRSNPFILR